MATARAIASGNWSATSTWNGGVLPGNGDTVYANGFTVTIDQNVDIGGANNPIVNAGSFVSGQWYEITSAGTTTFPGAASNAVGTVFLATGVGSGTGQARARATITTASNTAAGAASATGNFTMSTSYNMTCDIRPGTSHCFTVTGGSVTLSALNMVTVNSLNANCVNNTGSGTVTFDACNITLLNSAQSFAATNTGTGNLRFINGSHLISPSGLLGSGVTSSSVSGSVICEFITITGGGNSGTPIANSNTGSVTISNCIINGGGAACFGVNNTSSGTVTISNSTINGGSSNVAVQNAVAGTLICTNCTFTAIGSTAAVSSTNASATNRFSGTFVSSTNGTQPINAPKWILGTQPLNAFIQHARDGVTANSFDRFFTADNSTALNQAAPTDVRAGVVYGISNSQTGRLTVPARGSVSLNVNYGPSMPFTATRSGTTATATLAYSYPLVAGDQITVVGASNNEWNSTYTIASVVSGTSVTFVVPNTHSSTAGTGAAMQTTGTAVLDPAAVASAVWGATSRTITGGPTAADNASAVWAAASRTLTADIGPTAATIASAVWAAADKTGYSLTSAERTAIATAVESSILNEGDGQAVLNAIVGAIGNTNISQVALVAAIRSDLERTGGKIDSIPAAPTAAQNATAVWGASAKIITGGVVDTLTNAPASVTPTDIWSHATRTLTSASGPTAVQIRQEMDANSTKLDAAISSRLAASAYTAPANSDVTAIKAKTDAVNVDRINNTATLSQVGNLLAQANS